MKKRTFSIALAFLALCALVIFFLVIHLSSKNRFPITISKETTYITEPLRPDGHPDYIAALNRLASEGVTPENNAAVALVKIFGPDPIKESIPDDKNRKRLYKMLGIAPPSDKGDYFVDFNDYVERHAPEAMEIQGNDDASQWDLQEERAGSPWSAKDCPLMAVWLASVEKSIDRMIEASLLPRFYFPVIAENESVAYCFITSNQLRIRSAIEALTRRAMFRVREGKIEEAWNDLQACHRLAVLKRRGAVSFLEYLIAMTCEDMACHGDRQLAHYAKLTPEQAKQFAADSEELYSQWSHVEFRNDFDRFLYLDAICATERGRLKPIEIIPIDSDYFRGSDEPEWNSLRDSLTTWIHSGRVDWNKALRMGNEYFDRVAAIRLKPAFSEQIEAFTDLYYEFEKQATEFRHPDYGNAETNKKTSGQVIPPSKYTEGVNIIYLSQLDACEAGPYAEIRTAINVQLVPISMALSAYRTDNGSYPDVIEALHPKYLDRFPNDPFSDSTFRYRREDDGYLLYSVGPNGKDEQGPQAFSGGTHVRNTSDDMGVTVGRKYD